MPGAVRKMEESIFCYDLVLKLPKYLLSIYYKFQSRRLALKV